MCLLKKIKTQIRNAKESLEAIFSGLNISGQWISKSMLKWWVYTGCLRLNLQVPRLRWELVLIYSLYCRGHSNDSGVESSFEHTSVCNACCVLFLCYYLTLYHNVFFLSNKGCCCITGWCCCRVQSQPFVSLELTFCLTGHIVCWYSMFLYCTLLCSLMQTASQYMSLTLWGVWSPIWDLIFGNWTF